MRQVVTILVVEDEAEEREAIVEILRARGHTVIEAVDGRDGQDQFDRRQPELILCDILMPGRDGLEMIGALRNAAVKAPIIAMLEPDASRAALLQDIATALGANAVLMKPVLVSELLETVDSLLDAPGPPQVH